MGLNTLYVKCLLCICIVYITLCVGMYGYCIVNVCLHSVSSAQGHCGWSPWKAGQSGAPEEVDLR